MREGDISVSIPFSQAANEGKSCLFKSSGTPFPFLLVRLQTRPQKSAAQGEPPQPHVSIPFSQAANLGAKKSTASPLRVSIPFSQAANVMGCWVFWEMFSPFPFLLVRLQTRLRRSCAVKRLSKFPFLLVRLQTRPWGTYAGDRDAVSIPFSQAANRTRPEPLTEDSKRFHSFQLGCKQEMEEYKQFEKRLSFHSFQLGCKQDGWTLIQTKRARFHSFQLGCKRVNRIRLH